MSNIENGARNVTQQMFKSICREFGANEVWLRTGTGEMFVVHKDETAAIISGYWNPSTINLMILSSMF